MFQEPDYSEKLSLMLSEVLHDIGINERTVMRRRRLNMMTETLSRITHKLTGDENVTIYRLGSQSEGTTTLGLRSDLDILTCYHHVNVIQDWSEWEPDKLNHLMIQNETTSPGYCFLQLLRLDGPHPETIIPCNRTGEEKMYIRDQSGRILLKNIPAELDVSYQNAEQHGPSFAVEGQHGLKDRDIVTAYQCKSWPQSASGWLERRGIGRWPTQEVKDKAASTGCLVVPTGSKISAHPDLEWRISTTLAERCLMSGLNITQIRCYVLMKMILKSYLNPKGENNLSSFMCKTVLLQSVENTECMWIENNLFTCLTYCLLELQSCVQNEQCPHFIISENNLMAGQFTAQTKHQLSKTISDFLQSAGQWLLRMDIDDVGQRLQVKMKKVPLSTYTFDSSLEINEKSSVADYINFAYKIANNRLSVLQIINDKDIETIKQVVERLMTYSKTDNRLEYTSFSFLAPFFFTTLGSALASSCIGQKNQVSPEAVNWLHEGLTSDMASGRLKLASIFYCQGDMEKTEQILRDIERDYQSLPILPVCRCFQHPPPTERTGFKRMCSELNEDCIKRITTFCVKFLQTEINCVPRELQYEMFRSTQNEMLQRHLSIHFWMNMAVVDCLPYLYFLQYKTYGHLGQHQNQQQALSNLTEIFETEKNHGHVETTLNMIGQCMEQENRPQTALKCYLLSLQQRRRNNAAIIHICCLLSSLLACQ